MFLCITFVPLNSYIPRFRLIFPDLLVMHFCIIQTILTKVCCHGCLVISVYIRFSPGTSELLPVIFLKLLLHPGLGLFIRLFSLDRHFAGLHISFTVPCL